MSPEELEQCRAVLAALRGGTSTKQQNDYSIFAFPFDLAETPGYLDVCPKVMDLQTLANSLEAGAYSNKEDFYKDATLTFQNAITYHSAKTSSWIADAGQRMLKLLQKEREKAEKKGTKGSKKNQGAAGGGGSKLKLKLGGKSSTAEASSAKPKMSIKLPANSGKQVPAGGTDSKKPRLTLKLGKSKSDATAGAPTAAPSTSANRISIKASGGSRGGKELPKGVTAPPPKEKKKTVIKKGAVKKAGATKAKTKIDGSLLKKTKITAKAGGYSLPLTSQKASTIASAPLAPTSTAKRASVPMTAARKTECAKVILGLKRRKAEAVVWFLKPVEDEGIIDDYKLKVKNPIDLSTMESKLEKNQYKTVDAFVLDLRRITSNCLKFNTSIKDSIRPLALETFEETERLCAFYLAKPELPKPAYPEVLFCWRLCLSVIDTLYNLTNPGDGGMTAYYFVHPVTVYCGGQYPAGYKDIVSKPMDFGTVTANLIEGQYTTLDQFSSDCRLVLSNCISYYGSSADGSEFVKQAKRLQKVLDPQLDKLGRYVVSSQGIQLQRSAQAMASSIQLANPPPEMLQQIIDELRNQSYTDKATKMATAAMMHFENPVSTADFPTYPEFVQTPMDLSKIEKKIKSNAYNTPEDFEYDMILMMNNCIAFNGPRGDKFMVNLANFVLKKFQKLFGKKMKTVEDPNAIISPSPQQLVPSPDDSTAQQGAAKKLKLDIGAQKGGKTAPRLSLNLSKLKVSAATAAPARPKTKPGQPVPLHISISQVKQGFPLRRDMKSLQPWEVSCCKFLKELLKHPWFNPSKPKFIFHVPVPMLFPNLETVYAQKIKKPMDFTTVECTLLAGNKYAVPEDFVKDVALVFANSIVFNKEGKDIGDPLSTSYYEGSIHLLKYCRWLSLQMLTDHLEDSEFVNESGEDGMPPTSWRLTMGNLKQSRQEMGAIVLSEPLERSMDGDRHTWMESECEKLLKSLRHVSDARFMSFFLQPNYPADYETYISKPMDWETCHKKSKKRKYENIGELVDDLRLIFSNALKYNVGHKGTDSISGKAYEAAQVMSSKLETAISRMLVTASDRLERERIDQVSADREQAALDKAEEERIRAQWKKDASIEATSGPSSSSTAPTSSASARIQSSGSEKIRSRKPSRKMIDADFELPFFEDEDEEHPRESSYSDVIKQQKLMFEKQRQDLTKMQQLSRSLGASVFLRMQQFDLAKKWAVDEWSKKNGAAAAGRQPNREAARGSNEARPSGEEASSVLPQLEAAGRASIKLSLAAPKPKSKPKKNAKRPLLSLE